MKYDHMMTDIETLSTHVSNAFVLSFGLIPFNLTPTGPDFGKPRLILPNPYQQIAKGREIDPSTHKWWLDQTPEARRHWADPKYGEADGEIMPERPTLEALPGLLKDIWEETISNEKNPLWANGIIFDVGNLDNLCEGVVSWVYNSPRDQRTMTRHLPPRRERWGTQSDNWHDPVQDCINQTWHLWEVWPEDWEAGAKVPVAEQGSPTGA